MLFLPGCHKEKPQESDTFHFIVYPGSTYLPKLTELKKEAQKIVEPQNPEPDPSVIYDTDAPLETVAEYYVKRYGYGKIAPDPTNNLSSVKPRAYYRNGDLQKDAQAIVPLLQKMKVSCDVTQAQGSYRACDLDAKPNLPRMTIQRPYFDVTSSRVVNRTLILMAR